MVEFDVPQDITEEQQLEYIKLVIEAQNLDSEQRLDKIKEVLALHFRYVNTIRNVLKGF